MFNTVWQNDSIELTLWYQLCVTLKNTFLLLLAQGIQIFRKWNIFKSISVSVNTTHRYRSTGFYELSKFNRPQHFKWSACCFCTKSKVQCLFHVTVLYQFSLYPNIYRYKYQSHQLILGNSGPSDFHPFFSSQHFFFFHPPPLSTSFMSYCKNRMHTETGFLGNQSGCSSHHYWIVSWRSGLWDKKRLHPRQMRYVGGYGVGGGGMV